MNVALGGFHDRLLLLQSDVSQNHLPILKTAISAALNKQQSVVVFSAVTPASYFKSLNNSSLIVLDWTEKIPGYASWADPQTSLLNCISEAPPGSLSVVVDAADTWSQDLGSVSLCYKTLSSILSLVQKRPVGSRLIVSLSHESPLLPLLTPPSFSPTLTLVSLHSPHLIRDLAQSLLVFPPPNSPSERFWSLFSPAAARGEGERLALSFPLQTDSRNALHGIVEIVSRGPISGGGRARGVERHIEAWTINEDGKVSGIPWENLVSLQDLMRRAKPKGELSGHVVGEGGDSTAALALSFNLSLTGAQHLARSQVPLPYVHEGNPSEKGSDGIIHYDPDSADDIDDDDPDEDLDI